jgi:hypothetical protein
MRNPFEKDMQQHPGWTLAGQIVGSLLLSAMQGIIMGFAAGAGIVLVLKFVGINSIC